MCLLYRYLDALIIWAIYEHIFWICHITLTTDKPGGVVPGTGATGTGTTEASAGTRPGVSVNGTSTGSTGGTTGGESLFYKLRINILMNEWLDYYVYWCLLAQEDK